MNSKMATWYTIKRETEKAIMHSEFGWMPKSQITIIDTPMGKMVAVPMWLKMKVSRSDYRYGKKCWWAVDDKDVEANRSS